MDERLMQKATFSEICRVMESKDGELRKCMNTVVNLAILLFPGLMCKDLGIAVVLELGSLFKEVKESAESVISSVKVAFGKDEDFYSRYENARLAHILMVFAAYFDSVKLYLPDANREIALSDSEKCVLTQKSLDAYIKNLKNQARKTMRDDAKPLAYQELLMPNPVEGMDSCMGELKAFYSMLNKQFQMFTSQLAYVENLPDHQRDKFRAFLDAIPDLAVENYKRQYYDLAAVFPDFFVWTNQKEHLQMLQFLREIYRKQDCPVDEYINSLAHSTLEQLRNYYAGYVRAPIVSREEMPLSEISLSFPSRKTCFIPQAFQTLVYRRHINLKETDQWTERPLIGKFISDTLRSPELGENPMLILGDPGAGKTMLSHMLAAEMLRDEYHVIVLHLRNLPADAPIHDQIRQEIDETLQGSGCRWSDLAQAKLKKPVVLIFDGYDELLQATGQTHSGYLEKIQQFQEQTWMVHHIKVRCIVTSRIILIDKARIPPGCTVVRLKEFGEEQIDQWSKIWNDENASYFVEQKLQPLCVEPGSNAWNLAKQPLLLLMLALFDTNKNALRNARDLDAPRLYNSLIRDFIGRELRKYPQFLQKTEQEQEADVTLEMERLSVAALGMYNRAELHIHSDQLQVDLENLVGLKQSGQLTDSDRLLGSFFFLHQAKARKQEAGETVTVSAYLFLHNTFGEFLTAYFFVLQAFAVLHHIRQKHQSNKPHEISMKQLRNWYAAMCFAPLFNRPEIAEMVRIWAPFYFEEQGIDLSALKPEMEYLLGLELPGILNGGIIPDLQMRCAEFQGKNGYPDRGVMRNLAIYSSNLLAMAVLLYEQIPMEWVEYLAIQSPYVPAELPQEERRDPKAWHKLRHLWRMHFSDQDMQALTKLYQIWQPQEEKVVCKAIPSMHNVISSFSPSLNDQLISYFEAAHRLDEDLERGVLGVLLGNTHPAVIQNLRSHGIHAEALLELRSILDDYAVHGDPPISMERLRQIRMISLQEDEGGLLLVYYWLMENVAHCEQGSSPVTMASVMGDYGWAVSTYKSSGLRRYLLDLALRMPVSSENAGYLLKYFGWNKSLRDATDSLELEPMDVIQRLQVCEYVASVFDIHTPPDPAAPVRIIGLNEIAGLLYDMHSWIENRIRNKAVLSSDLILVMLRLAYKLSSLGYLLEGAVFLSLYKTALEDGCIERYYRIPAEHVAYVLRALWLCCKKQDDSDRPQPHFLLNALSENKLSLFEVYDRDPYAVTALCNLLRQHSDLVNDRWLAGLTNLVHIERQGLSMELVTMLDKLERRHRNKNLRKALDDLRRDFR